MKPKLKFYLNGSCLCKKMVGSYMVGCSNFFVEYDIITIAFLISV